MGLQRYGGVQRQQVIAACSGELCACGRLHRAAGVWRLLILGLQGGSGRAERQCDLQQCGNQCSWVFLLWQRCEFVCTDVRFGIAVFGRLCIYLTSICSVGRVMMYHPCRQVQLLVLLHVQRGIP